MLDVTGKISLLTIYNMLGEAVYSAKKLSPGTVKINMSGFIQGAYIVETQNNGRVSTFKILVK